MHGEIELHDEHVIFVLPQHLVEKTQTRAALGIEHLDLAHAGIDQEPDGEREIGFAREVPDGLRAAVFEYLKIVFVQIAKDFILLVAYRGQKVDHLDVRRKRGILLRACPRYAGTTARLRR